MQEKEKAQVEQFRKLVSPVNGEKTVATVATAAKKRGILTAQVSHTQEFISFGERSKANDVSSSMSRYNQTTDVKEREERPACFRFAS